MGFQDRRYDDGDGGFRRGMRLRMISGFFNWSLPLFTMPRRVPAIGGIHVRIHITYILLIVGRLLSTLGKDGWPIKYVASTMGTLFLLVLLHEFGHCVACRRVGGDADEVLMWPLGGLAMCSPPHRWAAALVTTIGGPGVNVVLLPVLGGALLATGAGWDLLIFNPLKAGGMVFTDYFYSAWHAWLWSAYSMNLMLLAFNLVVPMYPMDGAKIVQELLWWRIGYRRSMQIAASVGIGTAVVMLVLGLWWWSAWLICLAVFGATTCLNARRSLAEYEERPAWAFDTDKGYGGFGKDAAESGPSRAERRAQKAAAKERSKAEREQATVDAILDKIQAQGIQSLSGRERQILKDATDRRAGR